jgi:hypothetical protein
MDWRTGCTRSTVPITQKHPEELPRHLVGCHPHCVPAPPCSGSARPAGVSLRRPRSAVENVADLRGSRCGPHGSQMHVCGVSRVGPSRVRFVSDRVRARARGSRGPCEVRGDDNADRPPSFPFTPLSAVADGRLPNSEGQGAQKFWVIQFPLNPRPLGHSSHRASFSELSFRPFCLGDFGHAELNELKVILQV